MSLYEEYLTYLQHKDFFDSAKSHLDYNELCWLTGNYTDMCSCWTCSHAYECSASGFEEDDD